MYVCMYACKGWAGIHPAYALRPKDQLCVTNSIELDLTRAAASCAATQELLRVLQNPRVQYRAQKGLPLVPTLSQINSDESNPSYLFKIHVNIVLDR
jgi:hypothetical protein